MQETSIFNSSKQSNEVALTCNWEVAKFITWNNLVGKSFVEIKSMLSEFPDSLQHLVDCMKWSKYSDENVVSVCEVDYNLDILSEANCINDKTKLVRLFFINGVDASMFFRLDDYVRSGHLTLNDTLLDTFISITECLDGRNFPTYKKVYESICKKLSVSSSIINDRIQGSVFSKCVSSDKDLKITTESQLRKSLVQELTSVYNNLPNEFNDGTLSYIKEEKFSSNEEYIRNTTIYFNADIFICNDVTRLYSGYKVCINMNKFYLLKLSKENLSNVSAGELKVIKPCKYSSVKELCLNIFDKEDFNNGIVSTLLSVGNDESTDIIYDCLSDKDKVGVFEFDDIVPSIKDFKLSFLKQIIYLRMFSLNVYNLGTAIDTILELKVKLSDPSVSEADFNKLHSMYFSQLSELEEKYKTRKDLVVNTCILTYVDVYYSRDTKWWGSFMDDLIMVLF